ncbi:hypothetical protein P886_1324 [Alteromonadaceae bacterium 2753L.S.0a.02]|nr:hypothetical protein P886_1324 [Alteromonadaceae bacterium 2753L.S.0a.02]
MLNLRKIYKLLWVLGVCLLCSPAFSQVSCCAGPGPSTKVYVSAAACKALTSGVSYKKDYIMPTKNNVRVSCPIFHPNRGNGDYEILGTTGHCETKGGNAANNSVTAIECELDEGDRLRGYVYEAFHITETDEQYFGYMPTGGCFIKSGSVSYVDDGQAIRAGSSGAVIRCPLISHDETNGSSRVRATVHNSSGGGEIKCTTRYVSQYGTSLFKKSDSTTATGFTHLNIPVPDHDKEYLYMDCELPQNATFYGAIYED